MPASATILGCEGQRLSPDEAAFFREVDPWGFILFARNVDAPEQLRRLTGDLRDAVGREAFVMADQEGGRVQRLRAPHWREFLPPLEQMQRVGPAQAARAMWLRFRLIAEDLRGAGLDSNCAPCADIAGPLTHPFLKNRCYGEDLQPVVDASRAAVAGMLAGGVVPVVKHMPGHGRATADSHKDLPTVDAPAEELRAGDFAAFRALADLPMAMTAHIVYAALDPAAPATHSPAMIRLIREEIGFAGLLMTDDLNMQALKGTLGDRTAASIAAGCDIALHCSGVRAEMEEVVAAAGSLTPAAVARGKAALAARRVPDAVDIAGLEAELQSLLNGGGHG